MDGFVPLTIMVRAVFFYFGECGVVLDDVDLRQELIIVMFQCLMLADDILAVESLLSVMI